MNPVVHRPNPSKRWLPLKRVCATTAHTHSPPHPLAAIAKGQWGGVWNEIRSKYALPFRSSTQRRMRSGHVHFGRTATWKGTQDWCDRQDRFGLDLQINQEGVAAQMSKGGKAKGARRNSEFPSYLRPEALPGHIQPIRGKSCSQARRVPVVSCRSADIFHQWRRLFLPWVHFTILCP